MEARYKTKIILYSLLMSSLILFSLNSQDRSLLFVPREDHPFTRFSASGELEYQAADSQSPSSLVLKSDGKGGNLQVLAQGLPGFSLENKELSLWVKADAPERLNDLWIYLASDNDFSDRIVYKISNDKTQLVNGEWVYISIPPSEASIWGNPDPSRIQSIQFWCNDQGDGPVQVSIGPLYLSDITRPSAVLFTFDDGWLSQLEAAAPVMDSFGISGTAYVIPELIGTENYMTLQDIEELQNRYGWTIGAHELDALDNMDVDSLHRLFQDQKRWFEQADLTPRDFAYPMGRFSSSLLKVLPSYYRSGRTVIQWGETNPPGDPYRLRIFNIVYPFSKAALETRLKTMSSQGELLILVFHKIESSPATETEITPDTLQDICRMIVDKGLLTLTADQAFTTLSSPVLPLDMDLQKESILQPLGNEIRTISDNLSEEPMDIKELKPDILEVQPQGPPVVNPLEGTRIQFSLDWRMTWGVRDSDAPALLDPINTGETGDPQFYTQLDDLYIYIQKELSPSAVLHGSAGWEQVNVNDFSTPPALNTLYLEQSFLTDWTFLAGYYSPDPVKKWLQVSRSSGLESALGQTMTPRSLWLQARWKSDFPLGAQIALMPDLIGKDQSGSYRVQTYQQELGVPNAFLSLWYQGESNEGELALSVNGDAWKVALQDAWSLTFDKLRIAGSMGIKYTRGSTFTTFPEWDHLDNAWRFSTAWSCQYPLGEWIINPGAAFQFLLYSDQSYRTQAGLDLGLIYKKMEIYGVLTHYNLDYWEWGSTLGGEAGIIFSSQGVKYIAGLTMAGFHNQSGLYNNRSTLEGGVNGAFLRIKATYW